MKRRPHGRFWTLVALPAAAMTLTLVMAPTVANAQGGGADLTVGAGHRAGSPVPTLLASVAAHRAAGGMVVPFVAGYNKAAAVNYANTWTGKTPDHPLHNSNYPYFSSDCTNFVSQSLAAGGWTMTSSSGSQTDDHNWFYANGFLTDQWTHSWSVAYDLWQYMVITPRSSFQGLYYGGQMFNTFTPAAVTEGDVIEYNWYGGTSHNNGDDHWSMQVGYVPNVKNTVDSHTTDRYNVVWNLTSYNPNWQTTTARFWHIYN